MCANNEMATALLEELRKGPQSCSSPTKASGKLCKPSTKPLSQDMETEDIETEHKKHSAEGLKDSDIEGCEEEEDMSLVTSKNDSAEIKVCTRNVSQIL